MVTRSALQNAASIAKNILTTEAVVAEAPEKQGAMAGGMPAYGRHDVGNRSGSRPLWRVRSVEGVRLAGPPRSIRREHPCAARGVPPSSYPFPL
jgi:hypothetical protein